MNIKILIPNLLTLGNLSCGALAVYFSSKGDLASACVLMACAVILDGLDGWTARRMGQESRFGKIFDSTADFVSFGLSPALVYFNTFRSLDAVMTAAIVMYILASAIRLVRFSLADPGMPSEHGNNFKGLPTTASAAVLIFIIALSKNGANNLLIAPVFLCLSALMLSRIPFWKLNT